MYKIETQQINNYVESNLTEVEKQMFDFLVQNIPETMLYFDDTENQDLLTLLVVLAKVVGGSRELILNLVNAHDLPQIIYNILDANQAHLKQNNYQLLAKKTFDMDMDIDLNLLKDKEYQKTLEKYFLLMVDFYNLKRSRGTKAAIYQVLRDYNAIDPRLNFPNIKVFESGETDTISRDEYELLDKDTVDVSSVRIHLGEVPRDLADDNNPFVEGTDIFYLHPDTNLYNFIMQVKPAGIFYEIVVKALLYNMYIVEGAIDSNNDSTVWAESQVGNKFRAYKPLDVNSINTKLTFTDELTEVKDVILESQVKPIQGHPYKILWDIKRLEEVDGIQDATDNTIYGMPPYPRDYNTHTYPINKNSIPGVGELDKVESKFIIRDPHDYHNLKQIVKTVEVPEPLNPNTFELDVTQETQSPTGNKVTVVTHNENTRQTLYRQTLHFVQDDYYSKGTKSVLPGLYVYPSPGNVSQTFNNNTDKAWHGVLRTSWELYRVQTRTGNLVKVTKSMEPHPIKIRDKYGREDFCLDVTQLTATSQGTATLKLMNPNDFEVKANVEGEWWIIDAAGDYRDTEANHYTQTEWTLAPQETKTITHSLNINNISPDNRGKPRYLKYSFTMIQGLNEDYNIEAKETNQFTIIKTTTPTLVQVKCALKIVPEGEPTYNIVARVTNNDPMNPINIYYEGQNIGAVYALQTKDIVLYSIREAASEYVDVTLEALAQDKAFSNPVIFTGIVTCPLINPI